MKAHRVILGVLLLTVALGLLLRQTWGAALTPAVPRYVYPAERPATLQTPWRYVRAATTTGYVDSDDTVPDPNQRTWQNTAGYFALPDDWNTISLAFFGYGDGTDDGDANAGSFDCNVYLVEPYGSWEPVASFTVAIGELELTHYPAEDITNAAGDPINSGSLDPNESYKWGEGPFTDNLSDPNAWPATPSITGGTNGVGRWDIDPLGSRVLIVQYDNITSMTRVYGVLKGR